MADMRCQVCGLIMQSHEKARGDFEFIYNRLLSTVAFRVHQKEIAYVPGTIRHAKCEED